MALITCPECGAQISDKAECCPKCGIPMKENDENVSSCDNNDNVQKKKMLVWIIGIIVMCVMALCIVYATTRSAEEIVSHETEFETEDNVEHDFKETLDSDAIVAEISNSNTKKLYYLDNNDGMNRLMSYNYKTGTAKMIFETALSLLSWKLAGDRLFYIIYNGGNGSKIKDISYLDTNDESTHYITTCYEAKFEGNNILNITEMIATDTRGAHCDWEYDKREYSLNLYASEEEFKRIINEQQKIEEEYEQQRNQQQFEGDGPNWLQGTWYAYMYDDYGNYIGNMTYVLNKGTMTTYINNEYVQTMPYLYSSDNGSILLFDRKGNAAGLMYTKNKRLIGNDGTIFSKK